jgi:hypothetical protein
MPCSVEEVYRRFGRTGTLLSARRRKGNETTCVTSKKRNYSPQQLVHILGEMNSVHITHYFFKIGFDIILKTIFKFSA